MSKEVIEQFKLALEQQAEIIDQLIERADAAILDMAQPELPLWDDTIHYEPDQSVAWRWANGMRVCVHTDHYDLLLRPLRLEMRSSSSKPELHVSGVLVSSRKADNDLVGYRGYAPLGRLVLIRDGRWADGLQVDHRDKNPLNCASWNVEAVTHAINNKRKFGPPLPPLTEAEMAEQRRAFALGVQMSLPLFQSEPEQLPLPFLEAAE